MKIQIINILLPEVYHRYNQKYEIRQNLITGCLGLELRKINSAGIRLIQKVIQDKKGLNLTVKNTNQYYDELLVIGSINSFSELSQEIISLQNEYLGISIKNTVHNWINYESIATKIGNKTFQNNNSYVVGILNVTPDSFSDGGKYFNKDLALHHALEMLENGADIIDIGGESSRPGAKKVSVEEELDRVIPVINEILIKAPDTILSIDTTKKEVAFEALKSGVKIVNDISAGNYEYEIFEIVKSFNAAIILMHMKGTPQTMQQNPLYEDVISEIYDFLDDKIQQAKKAGICDIIIDPGIGFGKTVKDNYEIIKRLDEFRGLGNSIMIGLSRKSFLGKSLNLSMEERDIPTIIAESFALKSAARFIRTHNVKNAVYLKKISDYLRNPEGINV